MSTTSQLDDLLDYLRRSRGFDLADYKPSTVERRVGKRLGEVGLSNIGDYLDYLEVHPDEWPQLFATLLINVTGFFRDQESWDYVARELIPKMLAARRPGETLRVWSAGCASGEEPFTLAILLAEALGPEAFRQVVKIYATDLDEDALGQARHASYPAKSLDAVPPELRNRYFLSQGGRFVFNPEFRRSIIFGRHNLAQDAPMSRLDLLVCRNTLMYFNLEAQASILRRFHFGLNEGGFLYLGRAEMLLTHGQFFRPVDLKHRVFEKVPETRSAPRPAPEEAPVGAGERLRGILFENAPWGEILVSEEGTVVGINERARALFDLGPEDRGRPFKDLEASYRPVELRSLITQALAQRAPITVPGVEWRPRRSAVPLQLEVQVLPLLEGPGATLGAAVLFTDITEASRLRDDLRRTHTELETAYEELQSTNEELETTNEELQSSNEELETTNEELQASNEELETMNEELQSSNEELQTLNDELRLRSEDLNHANAFLESVLTSLRGAVVAVDDQLVVQTWSRGAEDLWGLRKDEAEYQALLELDIGLPMDRLRDLVRASQDGSSGVLEAVVEATNRRGKAVRCRITSAPRLGPDRRRVGLILLMEELEAAGDVASR